MERDVAAERVTVEEKGNPNEAFLASPQGGEEVSAQDGPGEETTPEDSPQLMVYRSELQMGDVVYKFQEAPAVAIPDADAQGHRAWDGTSVKAFVWNKRLSFWNKKIN